MDSYITLRDKEIIRATVEDRRSRFCAHLTRCSSVSEAQEFLATLRAEHYDARHHVSAWILSDGTERASDDGEPQRTSGMPTLEVLRGAGLADVCCVTVRYFGGILLGPGGLVRAYSAAAAAALNAARDAHVLVEMKELVPVRLQLAYADYDRVLHIIKQLGGQITDTSFTDNVTLTAQFQAGKEDAFVYTAREMFASRVQLECMPAIFAEFSQG
ncbi:YigZ family protein [Collinsella sp. zg1085]|uniref:IMPACT family protein n=1 Tax=Collinsella sp. zg1085 TaxID=2844380 RepID=UPI001C0C1A9D|nr:YigZ family protein [Collinsella sp. zg1085]QWT17172.1 YigZ family protein [Collinsella sp. zg1085]